MTGAGGLLPARAGQSRIAPRHVSYGLLRVSSLESGLGLGTQNSWGWSEVSLWASISARAPPND